jgi:hypothetical protein
MQIIREFFQSRKFTKLQQDCFLGCLGWSVKKYVGKRAEFARRNWGVLRSKKMPFF